MVVWAMCQQEPCRRCHVGALQKCSQPSDRQVGLALLKQVADAGAFRTCAENVSEPRAVEE